MGVSIYYKIPSETFLILRSIQGHITITVNRSSRKVFLVFKLSPFVVMINCLLGISLASEY